MPTGKDREERLQLYTWLLFLLCSLLFIADSVTGGRPLMIAAGVLFFLACVVALLPRVWKKA